MFGQTALLASGAILPLDAPKLSIAVSPELQTLLRGIAVALVAFVVIMALIKNMNFGRGGMGGGRMRPITIIVSLLVAAMLMDIELFQTIVNWAVAALYEVGQWVTDWLKSTSGEGGGGSVVIE